MVGARVSRRKMKRECRSQLKLMRCALQVLIFRRSIRFFMIIFLTQKSYFHQKWIYIKLIELKKKLYLVFLCLGDLCKWEKFPSIMKIPNYCDNLAYLDKFFQTLNIHIPLFSKQKAASCMTESLSER